MPKLDTNTIRVCITQEATHMRAQAEAYVSEPARGVHAHTHTLTYTQIIFHLDVRIIQLLAHQPVSRHTRTHTHTHTDTHMLNQHSQHILPTAPRT